MLTYGKHIRQNEICLAINNLSWLWVICDVTINLLVVTWHRNEQEDVCQNLIAMKYSGNVSIWKI